MIKSILLAVDGSVYTDSVLHYGIEFAKALNAHLRVLTVIDVRVYEWVINSGGEGYMPVMPANVYLDESQKFMVQRADILLEKAQKKLSAVNVSFEMIKEEGSPVEVICSQARQVDLLIMGSRGDYARWGDNLLGATLESVSRQCQTPLMVIDKEVIRPQKIIVAYDRSESSTHALKFSAYLAQSINLPVEIYTVHDNEQIRYEILNEAKTYLEPYKLIYNLHHEAGDAAEIIIRATHDSPERALLTMGSYGHSRIREAIIGSTTVQVMRKAKKPILLAK
jgi:nucleotide-binding universal stress UspA family protein